MKIFALLFLICFNIIAAESVLLHQIHPDYTWKWEVSPSFLSSGMETELSIEVKILDGIEVNLSSELENGDFDVSSVEHLPLQWDPPFWVHRLKANLSTRLPGEYRLPTQKMYLLKGDSAQLLVSPELKLKVHSLMKTDLVEKDHLKYIESPIIKKSNFNYEIILPLLLFLVALWGLLSIKEPKNKTSQKDTKDPFPSYQEFIRLLNEHGTLSDESKASLNAKLDFSISNDPYNATWVSLKSDWAKLRFNQRIEKEVLLKFCETCLELEKETS